MNVRVFGVFCGNWTLCVHANSDAVSFLHEQRRALIRAEPEVDV